MVEIAAGGTHALKRFYRDVSVAADEKGQFAVVLDGRTAKTPKRAPLAMPTAALADAVASEWSNAGDVIRLDDLRLTRLAATAIDLGAEKGEVWRAALAQFAKSDLLCYRAHAPATLVRLQSDAWDPMLAWARAELGAALIVTTGVIAIDQPPEAIRAISRAAEAFDAWRLIAVKSAAETTGSALLALALARAAFSSDAIFAASCIDEDHQASLWGRDAEAEARAARLRLDFEAASRFLRLLALQ